MYSPGESGARELCAPDLPLAGVAKLPSEPTSFPLQLPKLPSVAREMVAELLAWLWWMPLLAYPGHREQFP